MSGGASRDQRLRSARRGARSRSEQSARASMAASTVTASTTSTEADDGRLRASPSRHTVNLHCYCTDPSNERWASAHSVHVHR